MYEWDGVSFWQRPGKAVGISATVNYAGSYAIVSERDLSEGVAKLAALHTGQEKGPVERKVIEGNFEASRKAPAKQVPSGN